MKFVLLAEGDTEKQAIGEFLKRCLDRQLTRPVGIKVVNFHGKGNLVSKIASRAQDHLDGPDAGEIVAVIGMLDLYGLDVYPAQATTASERYIWAVQEFEGRVDRPKFRMFFAVHEVEAWILAQPDVLPREVRAALPATTAHPEKVNFDEPPAKLLNRLYLSKMRKCYKKTTYGRHLFGKLAPEIAVEKCPYLKSMLGEMLRLALEAGC